MLRRIQRPAFGIRNILQMRTIPGTIQRTRIIRHLDTDLHNNRQVKELIATIEGLDDEHGKFVNHEHHLSVPLSLLVLSSFLWFSS